MISIPKLVVRELRHRPLPAVVHAVIVAVAVGGFVHQDATAEAAARETRRIQRDAGSNLRLVPKDADLARVLSGEPHEKTVAMSLVGRLAAEKRISVNHLVALLERRVDVSGVSVVLTGVARSVPTPGKPKAPMERGVAKGRVRLGAHVARALGVAAGETVTVAGERFRVERVLLEKGTLDDLRLYCDLSDAQRLLGLAGRASEVRAIECVSCRSPSEDPLALLRVELSELAPEVRVLRAADRADTRMLQRTLDEDRRALVLPAILLAAAASIGALAFLNARRRQNEVGVLRVLGRSRGAVASLFLARAVLLGLVGAGLGATVGAWSAVSTGQDVYTLTGAKLVADWNAAGCAAALGAGLSGLAAFVPAWWAATRPPAAVMSR